MTTLSRRAKEFLKRRHSFMDYAHGRCLKNSYDETENPKGLINLGTAENKLVFDLLKEKLSNINVDEILPEYANYGSEFIPRFRLAMANFLNHYMKPAEPVDPFNLMLLSGMSNIIYVLGYIICDPGDGILIPSPYYGGFNTDLTAQSVDVIPFPVDLYSEPGPEDSSPFQLTAQKLEDSFEKAKRQNIRIRALLLTNPQNPLGDVYSGDLLRDCLLFAHRHSLHVIVDEVYMLSIFEEGHPPMKNALSLNDIPNRKHLHVAWGFSKDFGLSGIPCAVIHTFNKEVLHALETLQQFHNVPSITQLQLSSIISDLDWLDNVFVPTNYSRLRECHGMLCEFLERMKIPFLKRGSGLYVLIDLREFVSPLTREGEIDFCKKLLECGVYIGPGCEFSCAESGWFRIIFSVPPATLKVALERFEQVLKNFDEPKN